MKKLALSTCALALSAFALVQMTDTADARSRSGKGITAKSGTSNTGGRNSSSSAAGGNAAQPSRGAGSGGSSNSGGSQ